MKIHFPRPVAALWLFACFLFSCSPPLYGEEGWKAGTAKVLVTPEQPMWMSGYASRDHPAEGKLADLWAKALVLEDAKGRRGLLLTLDLIGIDRDLSISMSPALNDQFGLARKDIAICASHTHTGPIVGKNLWPMALEVIPRDQQELAETYTETLQRNVIDVVGQALRAIEPCRLQSGNGTATFAVNRRNNRSEAVLDRRAAGTLVGPFDHDVPVLAVRDAEGKLKAVVFGYACHATVLSSYQWSGDYPGFAQAEFERLHPGCQAMFWAGCGADQNPLPRRSVELAQHYGRQLANAVESVLLTSKMRDIAPQLETSYAEIDLELDSLPTKEVLQLTANSENRYEQAQARVLLAQIEAGKPLEPTYPYPIGTWKLGDDLRWIILGGEVVVDYALHLKAELEGTIWVAGYANDVMAYIPSDRVLREGGYEGGGAMVYYGLPANWAPSLERTIVDEVRRQTGEGPPHRPRVGGRND